MTFEDLKPDGPLSPEQNSKVEALTPDQLAQIDDRLLANCHIQWRKVAAVVGFSMIDDLPGLDDGVPDIFYAQRVRLLVSRGLLEAQGDLDYMRYSEVRLSRTSSSHTKT